MSKTEFCKQAIFYNLSRYTDNPKYNTMMYNGSGHILKIDIDYWEANLKDKTIFAINHPWSLSEIKKRLGDWWFKYNDKANLRKQLEDESSNWNRKEIKIEKKFDEYTGEPYIFVYLPSSHDIYYFADKVDDVLKGDLRKHLDAIIRIRKNHELKVAKEKEDKRKSEQKARHEELLELLNEYTIDIETASKSVEDILGYKNHFSDTVLDLSLSELLIMIKKNALLPDSPDYFTYIFNDKERILPTTILKEARFLLHLVLFKLKCLP